MTKKTTALIRNIVVVIAVLCLTLPGAFSQRRHNGQRSQSGQPGAFDFYLLNLSWEPEFCYSQRNRRTDECQAGGRGFVVHGLWPQFTNGFPEQCSNAPGPTDPSQMLDIMPSTWLVQHEWTTHGTCSGLSPEDYFALIRKARASIKIPQQFSQPSQSFTLAPSDVKKAFVDANPGWSAEDIAVSCGNNYLTAVEFCMTKDNLKPMACGSVRDCRATTIEVAPVR